MKKDMISIVSEGMDLNDCVDSAALSRKTTKHQLGNNSRIEWEKVEHLYILGFGGEGKSSDGPEKGCYISDDGTYAVVIGATNNQATSILNRCGTRLVTLDVRFMDIAELELHARLDNLRSLRLSPMLKLRAIDGLPLLEKLEALDLSFTNIGPGFNASGLARLKRLELVGNPKLKYVEWLSELSQLEELDLSGTSVGPELDLSVFKTLKRVKLIDTDKLKKVYGFGENPNLEQIDLSCSGITRIPDDIRKLKKLIYLDLSNLVLDTLPDWLPELKLSFTYCDEGINLRRTTVPGVDMEVFAQKYDWQSFSKYQEMIKQWFEARSNEMVRPLNEIKVVFLGDGDAGKSHTIARLMANGGEPVDYLPKAASGVAVYDKTYNIEDQQIQVHFWDFGGQEILHAMHRVFLTDRALYVVFLNARDNTPEERARYWLHTIKSFAQDAPVLIVLNKIDENPNAAVNEPALRAGYPGLREVLRLSALLDTPTQFRAVFVEALMRHIKQSDIVNTMFQTPWMRLKDKLRQLPDDYINMAKYHELCYESGVEPEDRETLLDCFADIGILLHSRVSSKLEDYIVLKPHWITDAISVLLYNNMVAGSGGILHHGDIRRILLQDETFREQTSSGQRKSQYTIQDVEYIMNLLREYRISFDMKSELEFFPALCAHNTNLDIGEYREDEHVLEFRMRFEHLPLAVLHMLIEKRRQELDWKNVWRTGARFRQSGTGVSAVVVVEGEFLQFFVCHTQSARPGTYLESLKETVDQIVETMGLPAPTNELIYKRKGKREIFDYAILKEMQKANQKNVYSTVTKRAISIADILNQTTANSLPDDRLLIEEIARSCRQLQANKMSVDNTEEGRNAFVRKRLADKGYNVYEGEADFDIRDPGNEFWAICEALQIKDGTDNIQWSEHFTKLVSNYNPNKLPFLVLMTYVDSSSERFDNIIGNYGTYIRHFAPRPLVRVEHSYQKIDSGIFAESPYIKGFVNKYRSTGYSPMVFHIFVWMGE